METMKVALFRSSLERRGGIKVRSFILNVSQLIGVMYETRSGRKRSMQNNSICLGYFNLLARKVGITGAVRVVPARTRYPPAALIFALLPLAVT